MSKMKLLLTISLDAYCDLYFFDRIDAMFSDIDRSFRASMSLRGRLHRQ